VGSDVTLATLGCVQQALARDLYAGDRYVFRGRRADLVKILWHDGIGMSLYAKRLERGRFVWPQAKEGVVALPPAPLSMLLAMILEAKFGQHLPLSRQSEIFAREGIDLDASTLSDRVGACTATTRQCRCWPRAKQRRAGCGPMCATTGHSQGPHHQRPCSVIRLIVVVNIPTGIWRAARAFCGPTLMPGSTICMIPAASLVR